MSIATNEIAIGERGRQRRDDAVAAVLTEELAVVDDWPRSVARLRFQRDENDFSTFSVEDCSKKARKFEPETRRLGLPEDAPAVG